MCSPVSEEIFQDASGSSPNPLNDCLVKVDNGEPDPVRILYLEHERGGKIIVVSLSAILIPGSTQDNVTTSARTLTCLSSSGTFWAFYYR